MIIVTKENQYIFNNSPAFSWTYEPNQIKFKNLYTDLNKNSIAALQLLAKYCNVNPNQNKNDLVTQLLLNITFLT